MSPSFLSRRENGFSIVELMVSIVIGMLALMFATRLIANAETSKQSSLGGSDSMQNGMLALFSITHDAAQAGWGLNDALITGCNTVFTDTGGFALAPAARGGVPVTPLAAALITSNAGGSDQISFYSGTSMSGTGNLRILSNYVAGTTLNVDRSPYGFSNGDVIVAAPETLGANCALAQVSGVALVSGQNQVLIAAGGANRFNSGSLGATFTGGQARLFNLGRAGTLSLHTWSVQNGFLQLRATDLAGAGAAPATVVDNVVAIKAQYGLDTRVGGAFTPSSGMQITLWSGTMIDADSDAVAGSAGDYQRIAAVRVAVVARSKSPEKADASGSCTATTALPVVFSSAEPAGVAAAPITVTVAVAGDTVDWRCYRYRVFETIAPVRNAGWRPT